MHLCVSTDLSCYKKCMSIILLIRIWYMCIEIIFATYVYEDRVTNVKWRI